MEEKTINNLLSKFPENCKNWTNEDMRKFALFIGVNYKKFKNDPVKKFLILF